MNNIKLIEKNFISSLKNISPIKVDGTVTLDNNDTLDQAIFIENSYISGSKCTTPKRKSNLIDSNKFNKKTKLNDGTPISPLNTLLNQLSVNKSPANEKEKCACGRSDHKTRANKKCPLNRHKTSNSTAGQINIFPIASQNFDSNSIINIPLIDADFVNQILPHIELEVNNYSTNQPQAVKNNNIVSKAQYLKEFNSKINGPLHEQEWVKDEISQFHQNIRQFNSYFCCNCHELWPTKFSNCETCEKSKKFTDLNNLNPRIHLLTSELKTAFFNLTMIEEMLISPILPIMAVYRLAGGQLVNRGYVVNFKQDITKIVKKLPRLTKQLPIIIVKKSDLNNTSKHDFCQKYQLSKNQLKANKNPEKTVIITSPKVRYNRHDIVNHKNFCYYQLIKYSAWTKDDLVTLSNKDTSIERFELFIKFAPQRIITSLNFFNEFLTELKRIRTEGEIEYVPEYYTTEFTELSELVPVIEVENAPVVDMDYDWTQSRKLYTEAQLDTMKD
ncbi:unnamed protein product [Brachionus calyciflorus]|uniref:DUF6570 domain-containing protein n=1 Tax=Brachionus calyciflorus TaxID=104777 RepID=A0A814LQB7_9BILA|nr:unnamed protein product [Brachionus calyciflorus]